MKILICGAGFAGSAVAYWLARSGHRVVIVERFPHLRATGAQVDLRAQGIEVVRRMQLLEAIQSKLVHEAGFSFVDSQGNVKATMMANKSGKGPASLTAEIEIMRGDLLRILYDATKDAVEYRFGRSVERFVQNEEQVTAYFSDNAIETFDLLIGADGQGSRIRKAILPPDAPEPYRRLGMGIAYWFIPRIASDSNISVMYHAPGGRVIMRRSHNPTETQVYFILRSDSTELADIYRMPVAQQKKFWASKLQGAGWQTDRFLKGMESSDTFYSQEVLQVLTNTWHKGHVVLVGDAAYSSAPAGWGVTASFVGAYVLAGEINRNPQALSIAFENYDKTFRPFVEKVQYINTSFLTFMIPQSQWGIKFFHFVLGVVSFLRIPELMAKYSTQDDGMGEWKLPEYSNTTGTAMNSAASQQQQFADRQRVESDSHRRGWQTSTHSGATFCKKYGLFATGVVAAGAAAAMSYFVYSNTHSR